MKGEWEEDEVVCVRGPGDDAGEDVSTSTRDFHCLDKAKSNSEDGG